VPQVGGIPRQAAPAMPAGRVLKRVLREAVLARPEQADRMSRTGYEGRRPSIPILRMNSPVYCHSGSVCHRRLPVLRSLSALQGFSAAQRRRGCGTPAVRCWACGCIDPQNRSRPRTGAAVDPRRWLCVGARRRDRTDHLCRRFVEAIGATVCPQSTTGWPRNIGSRPPSDGLLFGVDVAGRAAHS